MNTKLAGGRSNELTSHKWFIEIPLYLANKLPVIQ